MMSTGPLYFTVRVCDALNLSPNVVEPIGVIGPAYLDMLDKRKVQNDIKVDSSWHSQVRAPLTDQTAFGDFHKLQSLTVAADSRDVGDTGDQRSVSSALGVGGLGWFSCGRFSFRLLVPPPAEAATHVLPSP